MFPDAGQNLQEGNLMLEIIAETVGDALAAEAGGATQLDLKSDFMQDGLSPTTGMIEQICKRVQIATIAMIRPHTRSFVCSPEDVAVMCTDIRLGREHGAAGFLLGAITEEGSIDMEAVEQFQETARDLPLNFHLVWQATSDLEQALEDLIRAGVCSVRITGGKGIGGRAIDHPESIRRFQEQSAGRIELFLAGGVAADNIEELVQRTGVRHAHSGSPIREPANRSGVVSEAKVRALRTALDRAVAALA
jgi:copper homeostasis protein